MPEFTFSLQNTGDKYHIAVPTTEASMKRWKIILKLQIRQTASMGQAGRIQTGWVVCKMGRNWLKGCTQSSDQSVSSSGPHSPRKTQKKQERLQRSPMTWPLRNDKRRSLPWRRETLGGISSHYSSNYSWAPTKRTVFLHEEPHGGEKGKWWQFTPEKVSSLYKRKSLQWE